MSYFFFQYLNVTNSTDIENNFFYISTNQNEFKRCCLFRVGTCNKDDRTAKLVECLTNYEHAVATFTEVTFYQFDYDVRCKLYKMHFFAKQKNPKSRSSK